MATYIIAPPNSRSPRTAHTSAVLGRGVLTRDTIAGHARQAVEVVDAHVDGAEVGAREVLIEALEIVDLLVLTIKLVVGWVRRREMVNVAAVSLAGNRIGHVVVLVNVIASGVETVVGQVVGVDGDGLSDGLLDGSGKGGELARLVLGVDQDLPGDVLDTVAGHGRGDAVRVGRADGAAEDAGRGALHGHGLDRGDGGGQNGQSGEKTGHRDDGGGLSPKGMR